MAERTCFVVMGCGTRTRFLAARTLDLDKSYRADLVITAVSTGRLLVASPPDWIRAP